MRLRLFARFRRSTRPRRARGAGWGPWAEAGMAANLGVLIFTLVLGSWVDQVGYQPFFILLGVVDLVGALLLWTLIRKPA